MSFSWMRSLSFLVPFLLVFTSCGLAEDTKEDDGPNNGYQQYFIGGDEAKIGKEICSALKAKRIKLEGWRDDSKTLSFGRIKKDCALRPENLSKITAGFWRMGRGEYTYNPNSRAVGFIRDVLTDQNKDLERICRDLLNNKRPNNTNNDGEETISQVVFYSNNNGRNSLVKIKHLYRFRNGSEVSYKNSRTDTSHILVKGDSVKDEYLGFTKERQGKFFNCSNTTNESNYDIQILLEIKDSRLES